MARLLVIFLFFSYIFSATDFKQLIKVNSLLDHYSEHKSNDSSISFFDFLYMHYAGDDLVDTDDEKDMELPFKKFDAGSASLLSFVPSESTRLIKTQESRVQPILHSQQDCGLGFSASIWQPPRLA